MLNRMSTGFASAKSNLEKWGIIAEDNVECECREEQNVSHLTMCGLSPLECRSSRRQTVVVGL